MSPAPSVSTTSPGSSASPHSTAHLGAHRLEAGVGTGLDGRVRHLAPAHAGHRLLPRGVDLGHEHQVGRGERLPHRIAMGDRARVEVRLEDGDEPSPRKRLPRGRQRGRELGRMVSVVVHHRDTTVLAEPLEPAAHAARMRPRPRWRAPRSHPAHPPRPERATAFRRLWIPGTCEPQPSLAASAPRNRGLACRERRCSTSPIRTSASAAKPNRMAPGHVARPRAGRPDRLHSRARPERVRRIRRRHPRAPPPSHSTPDGRPRRC